jgi:hypothetical protein
MAQRIIAPLFEPLLLLLRNIAIVFHEGDAAMCKKLLENRSGLEKRIVFLFRAKLHDALESGAVVPTAIEQDDLAGDRKVLDISLEIPCLTSRSEGIPRATTRASRGDRCRTI